MRICERACLRASAAMVALLLSLPLLVSLAPVRRPSPVFEPKECRLLAGKAPDVDPVASRNGLDVLLGEPDLVGISRQRNSAFRPLAELSEVIGEFVLLDLEHGP